MIESDCKVSLFFCLIFVSRLYCYLRTICVYRPHHWCLPSAQCVRSLHKLPRKALWCKRLFFFFIYVLFYDRGNPSKLNFLSFLSSVVCL